MHPSTPDPEARQSEDELPSRKLVAVAIATLVIFAGGVVWAWWIWKSGGAGDFAQGPSRVPVEIGQQEIGLVFQPDFDQLPISEELHERQLRHLRSYGWVDRSAGVIHEPVDRAIERYLARRRP